MNFLMVIGVVQVAMNVRSYALEYSLLENLEINCPSRDYCKLLEKHENNFDDRSCECDDSCNDFYDCCIDKANLATETSKRTRKYPCMIFGYQSKMGVYVVDTCPHNYRSSGNISSLCLEDNDYSDPLMSAPVTDFSSGTTFKNRFCAECNGASPSSLESWLVYLNCETLIPFRLTDSFIWQRMKYNLNLRTWGIDYNNEFHRCEVIFDKPDNLTAVRFCRANTIDSCPSSFPRESIKRLCESYSAVVYDIKNSYKNPHCAICNYKRVKDLACLDRDLLMRSAKLRFPFSLAVLLDTNHRIDTNHRNESGVGGGPQCPTGEKYDPFFKKCRRLVCGLPGYKTVNGKCVKE